MTRNEQLIRMLVRETIQAELNEFSFTDLKMPKFGSNVNKKPTAQEAMNAKTQLDNHFIKQTPKLSPDMLKKVEQIYSNFYGKPYPKPVQSTQSAQTPINKPKQKSDPYVDPWSTADRSASQTRAELAESKNKKRR